MKNRRDKMLNDEVMLTPNQVSEKLGVSLRTLYTWEKEGSTHYYEVDFIFSQSSKVSAIEVKSSGTGKHESIKEFKKKFSQHIKDSYILSQKDVSKEEDLKFLPLYFTPFVVK